MGGPEKRRRRFPADPTLHIQGQTAHANQTHGADRTRVKDLADAERRIREFRKRQSEQDLQMRVAFASLAALESTLNEATNKIRKLEERITNLEQSNP